MSNKSSFEDKMRSKLESYEAPYDKKYWKGFTKAYPTILKTGFWQAWYWPYAFSLLLFAVGYWWFAPFTNQREADAGLANMRDTLYIKETIYVRDTLVIKDTLYLVTRSEEPNRKDFSRKLPKSLASTPVANTQIQTASTPSAGSNRVTSESATAQAATNQNLEHNTPTQETKVTPLNEATSTPKSLAVVGGESASTSPSEEKQTPAATPSDTPTSTQADRTADSIAAALAADFADLEAKENSAEPNRSVFLSGGPRTMLFLPPGTGDFDTYLGGFAGGQLALEVGNFAISTGLQYGFWHNEYDDLAKISANRLAQLPNYAQLTESPTEIEIVSEHLLMPMELSWLFYERRKWYARMSAGGLGNYLLSETFLYNTEDDEFRGRTTAGRSAFAISHLSAGVGLSYQLNQQVELQSQFNYFHPLRSMGISELNTGALGVQLGIHWLLLPR
jgi:hypothetical protein